MKQRVDGDVGRGQERSGVRRGRPGPGRRTTALDRQDRFAPREPPGDARELPGVAERFEVQQRDIGPGILLPVLEQVVAGQVGLVADRHERGQADPEPPSRLDDRDPDAAALRQEAHGSLRSLMRRKGRVEPHVRGGVQHPQAVGSDEAHAGAAADGEQVALPLRTVAAGLGEPRRDDQQRSYPGGGAVTGHVDDSRRGHYDDGEVDRGPDQAHRAIGRQPLHGVGVRVDGIHGAGESALDQVVEDLAADCSPSP